MSALTRVRYTITHHGVTIGVVDAHRQKEFAAGPVTAFPGYDSIREEITAASREMLNPAAPASTRHAKRDRGKDASQRERDIGYELELQNESGEPIAVDSIWLNDLGGNSKLSAIIIFEGASGTMIDMLRPGGRRG